MKEAKDHIKNSRVPLKYVKNSYTNSRKPYFGVPPSFNSIPEELSYKTLILLDLLFYQN